MIRLKSLLSESFSKNQTSLIKKSNNIVLKKLLQEQEDASKIKIRTIKNADGSTTQISTETADPYDGDIDLKFESGQSDIKKAGFDAAAPQEVANIINWIKINPGLTTSTIGVVITGGSSAYWGRTPDYNPTTKKIEPGYDKKKNIALANLRAGNASKAFQALLTKAIIADVKISNDIIDRIEFSYQIKAHTGEQWADDLKKLPNKKDKEAVKKAFIAYKARVKKNQYMAVTAFAKGETETVKRIPIKKECVENLQIKIWTPSHQCNQAEYFIYVNQTLIPNSNGGLTCNLNNNGIDKSQMVPAPDVRNVTDNLPDQDKLPGSLLNPAYGFLPGYGYKTITDGDIGGSRVSFHNCNAAIAEEIANGVGPINIFMCNTIGPNSGHNSVPKITVVNMVKDKDTGKMQEKVVYDGKGYSSTGLVLTLDACATEAIAADSATESTIPDIAARRSQLYNTRKQLFDNAPTDSPLKQGIPQGSLQVGIDDVVGVVLDQLNRKIDPLFNKFKDITNNINYTSQESDKIKLLVKNNKSNLESTYAALTKIIVNNKLNKYPTMTANWGEPSDQIKKYLYDQRAGGFFGGGVRITDEEKKKIESVKNKYHVFWQKFELLFANNAGASSEEMKFAKTPKVYKSGYTISGKKGRFYYGVRGAVNSAGVKKYINRKRVPLSYKALLDELGSIDFDSYNILPANKTIAIPVMFKTTQKTANIVINSQSTKQLLGVNSDLKDNKKRSMGLYVITTGSGTSRTYQLQPKTLPLEKIGMDQYTRAINRFSKITGIESKKIASGRFEHPLKSQIVNAITKYKETYTKKSAEIQQVKELTDDQLKNLVKKLKVYKKDGSKLKLQNIKFI